MLRASANVHEALVTIAREVGKELEANAKAKLGGDGQSSGLYAATPQWLPLASATIEDKLAKGFPIPSPLKRTAELHDSIGHTVEDRQTSVVVTLFATADYAPYQEMGTETIPPRPFIGPTVFESLAKIQEALADYATVGFLNPYARFPHYGTGMGI